MEVYSVVDYVLAHPSILCKLENFNMGNYSNIQIIALLLSLALSRGSVKLGGIKAKAEALLEEKLL